MVSGHIDALTWLYPGIHRDDKEYMKRSDGIVNGEERHNVDMGAWTLNSMLKEHNSDQIHSDEEREEDPHAVGYNVQENEIKEIVVARMPCA